MLSSTCREVSGNAFVFLYLMVVISTGFNVDYNSIQELIKQIRFITSHPTGGLWGDYSESPKKFCTGKVRAV